MNRPPILHHTENFKKVTNFQKPKSAINRRPKSTAKERSNFPKLNNSNISYNGLSVKNGNDSSFSFTAKLSSSLMDKGKLYEETLQLKSMVNQLKNEIALIKSDIRKKEIEILKKEKIIDNALNVKNKDEEHYDILKDQNEISKMKNSFKALKKELLDQKEINQKIIAEIKSNKLMKLKNENSNILFEIKKSVIDYSNSVELNQDTEMKVQEMKSDSEIFKERHVLIRKLQEEVEISKKRLESKKAEIEKVKEEIGLQENYYKKKTIENNNLQKQNEKILSEKKQREKYFFQKPVYEKKIEELEKKMNLYKDHAKNNEKTITELQKQNAQIEKKNKELSSHIIKPINYNALKQIEENPNHKINSKILLLKSLIKESKKRQEEFIDIISHYENYIEQKKSYEKIKDEEKEVEDTENEEQRENDDNNNLQENLKKNDNNLDTFQENKNEQKKEEITKKDNDSSNYEKFEAEESVNEDAVNQKGVLENNLKSNKTQEIQSKNKNAINEINTPTLNPISFGEVCSKKEKKMFKFLLKIAFSVNLINDKMANETIIEKVSLFSDTNDEFINDLCKKIFSEIHNTNQNDFHLAQVIYEDSFVNKYKCDKEKFLKSFEKFFKKIHLFTPEEEISSTEKFKEVYFPRYDSIMEKINANKKEENYISYYQFKKIIKSEKINRKDLLFVFVIYKMKHISDTNISLFDLSIPQFNELSQSIMSNKNEALLPNNGSSDTSVQMTEEEYKKIIETFLSNLYSFLKQKKTTIREIVNKSIRKIISKETGIEIEVVNIYQFFNLLSDKGLQIEDEIIKGCIFTQFQLDENEEDINLLELEKQLEIFNN